MTSRVGKWSFPSPRQQRQKCLLTLLNVTRVRLSSLTWHQECGFHVHKSGEPANGITRRKLYMIVTNYQQKTKRKCPQPISSASSKKKRKSFSSLSTQSRTARISTFHTAFLSHMDTGLCFYCYYQYLVGTSLKGMVDDISTHPFFLQHKTMRSTNRVI
jgi:hypothetical protein